MRHTDCNTSRASRQLTYTADASPIGPKTETEEINRESTYPVSMPVSAVVLALAEGGGVGIDTLTNASLKCANYERSISQSLPSRAS